MSNIDKIAKINLENKPYVKPISNVGIGFYNLDNGTAKLQFSITRDGFPMQMGPVNVAGYLWLKSTNGTMSGQLDLEIIDGLNGIVGVTIPNWFLVGATDTDVNGQIILAVNENTDIATLGEFGFHVKDALPNQIKGEIKVQYFKMFDDMKQALEGKVADIESRLGDLDILIGNVETTVTNGISQINQTVSERKSELDEVIDQYSTEVNNVKTTAIDEVNTAKSNAISTVDSKSQEVINNVNTSTTEAVNHVDDKLNEFNQAITNNEFVQPETMQQTLDNLQWQKHKLTENDGFIRMITNPNLSRLDDYFTKTEVVYIITPAYSPHGTGYSGFLKAYFRSGGYGIVEFQPYNAPNIYQNRREGNGWTGWKEITNNQIDTGWITYQTINGVTSNTAFKNEGDNGFDCAYRTITNGKVITKKVRINATQVAVNQVLAQLPTNFAKSTQRFPVGNSAFIVIKPNGEVSLRVSGDELVWDINNEIYIELTWHD